MNLIKIFSLSLVIALAFTACSGNSSAVKSTEKTAAISASSQAPVSSASASSVSSAPTKLKTAPKKK